MKTNEAITAALKGESNATVIYWDKQDPHNIGPAYRREDDSGGLVMSGWAHISGRALTESETLGYNISDYFTGPDGAYQGPDSDGIYPVLEAE